MTPLHVKREGAQRKWKEERGVWMCGSVCVAGHVRKGGGEAVGFRLWCSAMMSLGLTLKP